MYRKQWSKPSLRERKGKNGCLRKPFQIAKKRREDKGKGEKERYTHLEAGLRGIERRDKKAFLSDKCKEIEENIKLVNT